MFTKADLDDDGFVEKVTFNKTPPGSKPTKFTEWTLPGGENYKELLFTLPDRPYVLGENEKLVRQNESDNNSPFILTRDGEVVYNTDATTKEIALQKLGSIMQKGTFKSSHWDEPNVFAHTRVNDRFVNGKKYLHIEEIQSDYSIEMRKFRNKIKNLLDDKTTFERVIAKMNRDKKIEIICP